jgi:hypothetical protein
MIKVRITVTSDEDITKFETCLKMKYKIIEKSDKYKNRGESEYYRLYYDIEEIK